MAGRIVGLVLEADPKLKDEFRLTVIAHSERQLTETSKALKFRVARGCLEELVSNVHVVLGED